jgi:hypothetical protein
MSAGQSGREAIHLGLSVGIQGRKDEGQSGNLVEDPARRKDGGWTCPLFLNHAYTRNIIRTFARNPYIVQEQIKQQYTGCQPWMCSNILSLKCTEKLSCLYACHAFLLANWVAYAAIFVYAVYCSEPSLALISCRLSQRASLDRVSSMRRSSSQHGTLSRSADFAHMLLLQAFFP